METITRLLRALGVISTPAAVVAASIEVSVGEAAFILDAAERFEDLFGRSMFQQCEFAGELARLAGDAEEREKFVGSFTRQMDARGRLLWGRSTVTDCGEGLWAWPGVDGEGEA